MSQIWGNLRTLRISLFDLLPASRKESDTLVRVPFSEPCQLQTLRLDAAGVLLLLKQNLGTIKHLRCESCPSIDPCWPRRFLQFGPKQLGISTKEGLHPGQGCHATPRSRLAKRCALWIQKWDCRSLQPVGLTQTAFSRKSPDREKWFGCCRVIEHEQ